MYVQGGNGKKTDLLSNPKGGDKSSRRTWNGRPPASAGKNRKLGTIKRKKEKKKKKKPRGAYSLKDGDIAGAVTWERK